MNYISEYERRLNALDIALAGFYELPLYDSDRRNIDAMVVLYHLIREQFNDGLKSLAK